MTNSDGGFSGTAFKTSAARRAGKTVQFNLSDVVYETDEDGEIVGEGTVVEHTLMVDPRLDIVRLGAMFTGLGAALQAIGNSEVAGPDKLKGLDRELPVARANLRSCLTPPSRLKFDYVSAGLDAMLLGDVIRYITSELGGLNPTQPKSPSPVSAATGSDSEGGVSPVESNSSEPPLPTP